MATGTKLTRVVGRDCFNKIQKFGSEYCARFLINIAKTLKEALWKNERAQFHGTIKTLRKNMD